jgi:hypothetical protein
MEQEKKIRIGVLSISIGLYILSLTQDGYCSSGDCHSSAMIVLVGILGFFMCPACLSWLANPVLIVSWIALKHKSKASLITSAFASFLSISFLFFDKIVDDESGSLDAITALKSGYWLWMLSCVSMLVGNLIIAKIRKDQ